MSGRVYLVGAGPGDPGLITARGLEVLRRADAVVYDRLIGRELLRECRPGAELYDVGKVPGQHGRGRQAEISGLLVRLAVEGKSVLRLKGGDPFVFGRGGEEAQACSAARVPFEVVPGVSSALAAPAYAGIPVTHRAVATSFAVVTGHEDPAKPGAQVNWEQLATGVDTILILMGIEQLPAIVEQLLAHGRAADTPAAIVSKGTVPEQRTLVCALAHIADRAKEEAFEAPAVIVVGDVVRLREEIRWYDSRPLSGKRILVPRTREKPGVIAPRLRELGALVTEVPEFDVEPLNPERMDSAIQHLTEYGSAMFTSPGSVAAFWARLEAAGMDARALAGLRVVATGAGTAHALASHGIRADASTPKYLTRDVYAVLAEGGLERERLLLLRSLDLGPALRDQLESAGAVLEDIPAYRAVPRKPSQECVRELVQEADTVVFTCARSVHALADLLGGKLALARGVRTVCIGPKTAEAARGQGISVDATCEQASFDALVEVILELESEVELAHLSAER